jgi:hypothetical protein
VKEFSLSSTHVFGITFLQYVSSSLSRADEAYESAAPWLIRQCRQTTSSLDIEADFTRKNYFGSAKCNISPIFS